MKLPESCFLLAGVPNKRLKQTASDGLCILFTGYLRPALASVRKTSEMLDA